MNKKAFTLIELAVVAIIIGVLTLIAVPNMLKGISRGYGQDAMRNLMAIYAAQQNYAQDHDNLFKVTINSTLNADLGLNIVPNGGTTYSCNNLGPVTPPTTCTAVNTGSGAFTMEVDLTRPVTANNIPHYYPNSNTENPYCTGGTAGSPCP